jgi:P-type Cu+ transporter
MPNATLLRPTKQPIVKSECYHCHDEIKDTTVHFEDKDFCCEGCKTVYQILNENDMCAYYALDANAGVSQKGKNIQFAYLDDAEVVAKIVDFQDENTTRVTFLLPQMHCASCIWLLENLYKINPSV